MYFWFERFKYHLCVDYTSVIHSKEIYSRKMARTTINIDKEMRDALQKIRKYPRETYDDVLLRLVQKQLKQKEIKKTLKGK